MALRIVNALHRDLAAALDSPDWAQGYQDAARIARQILLALPADPRARRPAGRQTRPGDAEGSP